MRKHLILSTVIIAVLVSVALISGVVAQQDSDNDGISDTLEEQLAERYEPVLHFASVAFLGIFFWNRRQQSFSEMFTGSEDPIN